VEEKKLARMQHIAEHFGELHLEKVDKLDLIEQRMWQELDREKLPYRRVKILESIATAQPIITAYYNSSVAALDISERHSRAAAPNDTVNSNGRQRVIIPLLPTAVTTTTKQEPIIPTPSMGDLIGRTIEPWTEPSWPQCNLCKNYYKPTVIEFHKRICSYNGNPNTRPEPEQPISPPEEPVQSQIAEVAQEPQPEQLRYVTSTEYRHGHNNRREAEAGRTEPNNTI
jgi:hypothetical protein